MLALDSFYTKRQSASLLPTRSRSCVELPVQGEFLSVLILTLMASQQGRQRPDGMAHADLSQESCLWICLPRGTGELTNISSNFINKEVGHLSVAVRQREKKTLLGSAREGKTTPGLEGASSRICGPSRKGIRTLLREQEPMKEASTQGRERQEDSPWGRSGPGTPPPGPFLLGISSGLRRGEIRVANQKRTLL